MASGKKKNNKKKIQTISIIAVVIIAVIALSLKFMKAPTSSPVTGLDIETVKAASGDVIKKGQLARVHYTGWLTDGTKFDSSKDRNEPFEFRVGGSQVIKGWDLGVEGMTVGEIRKLTIASPLGYGERGAGNVIPPNATLVFEVELLGISE